MGISLKKHNEEAYKKVKDMFKESNKTAVVHPTGTGKTYIALKWIEESRGKTIYVSPNNHILNQVREEIERARGNGEISEKQYKRYKEVKYITYTSLMTLSKMERGYDNIILDEFHRCGATEWGKGVDRLIKQSPSAKVLGMTATPVRAVDNRNMADELFEGNIASEMTLEEAVAEGIIEVPVYVNGIYSLKEAVIEAESKLDRVKNETTKKELKKDIEKAKKYLEQSDGIENIFAKYVGDKKEGKYIVFCSDIDDMHNKMQEAQKWFEKVGETRPYEVSYKKSEVLNEDTIKRFREEEGKINLLFTVDKLNEGMHIDGIDGVIMLRKTESPIIYMQQLGRALSAGNKGTPIVFDLVNNIESSKYIYKFMERVQQIREERGIKDKAIGNLKIYDEQRNIREILERITEKLERTSVSKLIEIIGKLKKAGVNVTKLPRGYKGEKTLLKNIKAQDKDGNEIDISEVVEVMDEDYNIGNQIYNAVKAAKGTGKNNITQEEIEELIGYRLITREEIEKAKAKKENLAKKIEQNRKIQSEITSAKKLEKEYEETLEVKQHKKDTSVEEKTLKI